MKIKTDFVTNSSSSSFIVAFPKRIKTMADVIDLVPDKYARTVFEDAIDQKPLTLKNPKLLKWIANEIRKGYIEMPLFSPYDNSTKILKREGVSKDQYFSNRAWQRLIYDEITLRENAASMQAAIQLIERFPDGSYIYLFNYGDDSGEYYAEMEHNDIFRKLQNQRINKH